jgi:cell division protein FtsJ
MSNLRKVQDYFFRLAKQQGYVARSAFKLQEVDDKYRVLKRGGNVLDLGCNPGAWLQVACRALGPPAAGGIVLGVDLKDTPVPAAHCDSRVRTLKADAKLLRPEQLLQLSPDGGGFHSVLSDMAPSTSGVSSLDAARSLMLAELAVDIALGTPDDASSVGVLRPGGSLVVKLLEGPGDGRHILQTITRSRFERIGWMRPKATRPESCEVFLVATGFKR